MIQTFGRDKVICERCGATALTFYTQCDNPKEKIGCEGEKKVAALFSMKDEVCKYYDYFTGQTVVIEKRYER